MLESAIRDLLARFDSGISVHESHLSPLRVGLEKSIANHTAGDASVCNDLLGAATVFLSRIDEQRWAINESHLAHLRKAILLGRAESGADSKFEDVAALDGRIFATLSPPELATFEFYRAQGRRYGVHATVVSAADPELLAQSKTRQQEDAIMRSVNSTISIVLAGQSATPIQSKISRRSPH